MVIVTESELEDEFSTFGINLNEGVIDKLIEMCQTWRIDAGDIAEQWLAFSHSNRQCKLNPETLDTMIRDRQNKAAKAKPKASTDSKKDEIASLSSYVDEGSPEVVDQLIDAYGTPSGKKTNKRQHTPDTQTMNKRLTGVVSQKSPAAPFSPASFSPANATPSKYGSRGNQGQVVCSAGPVTEVRWTRSTTTMCTLDHHDPTCVITNDFQYMFQKLVDKSAVLDEQIEVMGEYLKEHHKLEDFSPLTAPVQEDVTVLARVCCDSIGKLNSKSVVLEGSRETSGGRQIPVDLDEVRQYSLFPGQIIALDGINSSGRKFVAKKIYEGVPCPLARLKRGDNEELHVVVAAGPFSTSDNLYYQPLTDLIAYLNKHKPHVCVLMGPFLDSKNEDLKKGLDIPYEQFFQKTMENLANSTAHLPTHIIVMPSQRDVHHEPIYPQPPFSLSKDSTKDLKFMSDPCTLTVDGVVIGLTSTDILLHLGAEEISCPRGGSDRLSRLARHILTQHSYYPLYPCAEEDVSVDYDLWEEYGRLPVTPHILVLPSDLRFFIKDVCGSCCVNPGRLTKGQVAGTFAHLVIQPSSDGANTPTVAAKVIRI